MGKNDRKTKTPRAGFLLAEEVGFEPTVPCDTPVFKTGALDHYATPPISAPGPAALMIPQVSPKEKLLPSDGTK